VIPSTLVGVLVFAASIGPGYVWVRIAERRQARQERSALLEAAELVVIGGLASTIAALLVVVTGEQLDLLDPVRLSRDGGEYLISAPERALGAVAASLFVAYAGAAAAARLWYWRAPPTLEHGYSAFHKILQPGRPQTTVRPPKIDRLPYVTVGLRNGLAIAGWSYAYTVEPVEPERRELVLATPIRVRSAGAADFIDVDDQLVYLNGSEIVTVSVTYHRIPPEAPPARRRFGRLRGGSG
jgi:hypothetical protein